MLLKDQEVRGQTTPPDQTVKDIVNSYAFSFGFCIKYWPSLVLALPPPKGR